MKLQCNYETYPTALVTHGIMFWHREATIHCNRTVKRQVDSRKMDDFQKNCRYMCYVQLLAT